MTEETKKVFWKSDQMPSKAGALTEESLNIIAERILNIPLSSMQPTKVEYIKIIDASILETISAQVEKLAINIDNIADKLSVLIDLNTKETKL